MSKNKILNRLYRFSSSCRAALVHYLRDSSHGQWASFSQVKLLSRVTSNLSDTNLRTCIDSFNQLFIPFLFAIIWLQVIKRRLSFISCHVVRSLKKQCFKSLWSAAVFPIFMWLLFRDCCHDFFRLVLKLS